MPTSSFDDALITLTLAKQPALVTSLSFGRRPLPPHTTTSGEPIVSGSVRAWTHCTLSAVHESVISGKFTLTVTASGRYAGVALGWSNTTSRNFVVSSAYSFAAVMLADDVDSSVHASCFVVSPENATEGTPSLAALPAAPLGSQVSLGIDFGAEGAYTVPEKNAAKPVFAPTLGPLTRKSGFAPFQNLGASVVIPYSAESALCFSMSVVFILFTSQGLLTGTR